MTDLKALTERASMAAEIERLKAAIKIQASAVRTLQANEDTEINILRKQKREWHQAVSSLDSEREVNEILTAENERLRGLVEELADDLEVEVQDRWGYDERLAHKLKRDMDVIVRARAALEARP